MERRRIETIQESAADVVASQLKERVIGQDEAIETVAGCYDKARLRQPGRPVANLMFLGPTGTGKCLGLGTQVLMANGKTKAVEDIKTGEQVMGYDSKPRTVLSTVRDHGQMYRIIPVKGDPWECNDVHVLTLKRTDTGEVKDVPLNEYLKWSKTQKHLYKQFSVPVEFTDPQELPLDPYFIGTWLGDGTKSLKGVQITKPDVEVISALRGVAAKFGCDIKTYKHNKSESSTTYGATTKRGISNPLLILMRSLFPEIRIPHMYLTASREQRLELLAGLLDTDGHYSCGGFEIAQRRCKLADDIAFLARSLGFRVTRSVKTVKGVDYQRLFISGDCSVIPMRIERKVATLRKQVKDVLRTGFRVEPLGDGEYAGFTLDGDGRFLLGDFTVTHNTELAQSLSNIMAVDKLHPSFIRIDCAQFAQGHEVAALVGSPPGYVGREQDPILDPSIIEVPGSVVLFDEIEKGHPKLWNYLLQIMEGEGVKLLNSGYTVNFNNATVIMTSNVGAKEMEAIASEKRIGFGTPDLSKPQKMESVAMNALKKQFAPEFINRLDAMVTFKSLTDEQLEDVLQAHVTRSNIRYERQGNFILETSPELRKAVVEGSELRREFNARPVLRNYERMVESKLSRMVNANSIGGNIVHAEYEEGEVVFYEGDPMPTYEDLLALESGLMMEDFYEPECEVDEPWDDLGSDEIVDLDEERKKRGK